MRSPWLGHGLGATVRARYGRIPPCARAGARGPAPRGLLGKAISSDPSSVVVDEGDAEWGYARGAAIRGPSPRPVDMLARHLDVRSKVSYSASTRRHDRRRQPGRRGHTALGLARRQCATPPLGRRPRRYLLPDPARRRPPGDPAGPPRRRGGADPRWALPAPAHPRARLVPGGPGPGARRDRRRGARHPRRRRRRGGALRPAGRPRDVPAPLGTHRARGELRRRRVVRRPERPLRHEELQRSLGIAATITTSRRGLLDPQGPTVRRWRIDGADDRTECGPTCWREP